MKKAAIWLSVAIIAGAVAGCSSDDDEPGPTIPPMSPTHQIAGSILPESVGGYTALGAPPVAGETQATYVMDSAPLEFAEVILDPTGDYGETPLTDQEWYGVTRCGILWRGDAKETPRPIQSACITVLTDGVMATVAGGTQTPQQLADLANEIYGLLE